MSFGYRDSVGNWIDGAGNVYDGVGVRVGTLGHDIKPNGGSFFSSSGHEVKPDPTFPCTHDINTGKGW